MSHKTLGVSPIALPKMFAALFLCLRNTLGVCIYCLLLPADIPYYIPIRGSLKFGKRLHESVNHGSEVLILHWKFVLRFSMHYDWSTNFLLQCYYGC
jgi:hypothetical protein